MLQKRIYLFSLSILLIGFLFLVTAQIGLAGFATVNPYCCQSEGDCVDSTEGPIACIVESVVEDAICNEDTRLCETILQPRSERQIPTLTEWGLMAMAGLMGIVGFIVIRRRKVAA
jgi:hypothetical protein